MAAAAAAAVTQSGGPVSAAGPQTKNFKTGDLFRKIPDTGAVVQKIEVPARGKIRDVNVAVRIEHPMDSDVTLLLQHPYGRTVLLAGGVGGETGANFGSGPADCTGTRTTFSDEAPTAISDGTAPFDGPFKPQQPLSRFDDKGMHGTWRLIALDDHKTMGPGVIRCVALRFRYSPG